MHTLELEDSAVEMLASQVKALNERFDHLYNELVKEGVRALHVAFLHNSGHTTIKNGFDRMAFELEEQRRKMLEDLRSAALERDIISYSGWEVAVKKSRE